MNLLASEMSRKGAEDPEGKAAPERNFWPFRRWKISQAALVLKKIGQRRSRRKSQFLRRKELNSLFASEKSRKGAEDSEGKAAPEGNFWPFRRWEKRPSSPAAEVE